MLATVLLSLCLGGIFLLAFNCFFNPGKANATANQWLGLSFMCFGFALLSDLFEIVAIAQRYPFVNVLSEITRLAMAPAFYLSVLFFTTPNRTFRKSDWLHFIPFFLFIINCSPVFFGHPPYFSNRLDAYEAGKYIRLFMFMVIKVQVIVYWIISYVALVRHQKNIQLIFSSLQPVNLKWLNYLLISLLFAVLIWLNQELFQIQWINDYSALGYLVIIYSLSYSVLRQKEVFSFPVSESKQIESIITPIDSPK